MEQGSDGHGHWLRRAVALSQAGLRAGAGGPFGCVIVRDGAVVGEGYNQVLVDADPTAHAEIVAIRRACAALGDHQLTGCVVYASSEPCPMCLGAIYWARPDAVVFANPHARAAAAGFDDSFIYAEIARDPADRAIPFTHLPIPGADLPFEEWSARENSRRY